MNFLHHAPTAGGLVAGITAAVAVLGVPYLIMANSSATPAAMYVAGAGAALVLARLRDRLARRLVSSGAVADSRDR